MGPRTKPNIMNMILLWEVWQSPWTYFQLFIPILIGSLVVGCGAASSTGGRHGLGIRIGTPWLLKPPALLINPIEPFLEANRNLALKTAYLFINFPFNSLYFTVTTD